MYLLKGNRDDFIVYQNVLVISYTLEVLDEKLDKFLNLILFSCAKKVDLKLENVNTFDYTATALTVSNCLIVSLQQVEE